MSLQTTPFHSRRASNDSPTRARTRTSGPLCRTVSAVDSVRRANVHPVSICKCPSGTRLVPSLNVGRLGEIGGGASTISRGATIWAVAHAPWTGRSPTNHARGKGLRRDLDAREVKPESLLGLPIAERDRP